MALTDGLVHGWNMNNDWLDAFGTADGTPNGAFLSTPAPLGSHQGEGDGIDDRVTFGSPISFDYNEPFSFSFILTPKDLAGSQVFLSTMQDNVSGMEIVTVDGKLFFRIAQSWSAKAFQVRRQTLTLSPQHIVCSYDGSNTIDGLKIYLDNVRGEEDNVNAPMDGTIAHNGFSLFARADGSFAANMKMDAVYYWDRELSPSNVSELYNGGSYLELTGEVEVAGYIPFFFDGGHY